VSDFLVAAMAAGFGEMGNYFEEKSEASGEEEGWRGKQ
jgi:hypothetical protein